MAIFFPQFFPKGKKMGQNPKILPQILVPLAGLEPARSLDRGILSPLRLPIPPQRRVNVKFFVRNSQNFLKFLPQELLSPLRLPIPPHERVYDYQKKNSAPIKSAEFLFGGATRI